MIIALLVLILVAILFPRVLKFTLALFGLIILYALTQAHADTALLRPGTDYGEARRGLFALGYEPIHLPNADKCGETDMRCQGRPEMRFCSGTGRALCGFLWLSKDKMLIEVITIGED